MTDQEIIAQCVAAGFITPEGKVRKVLGKLFLTADGHIVGEDCELHMCTSFPRSEQSMAIIIPELVHYNRCGDYVGFDLADCYETKAAALEAGLAYNAKIQQQTLERAKDPRSYMNPHDRAEILRRAGL